MRKDNAGTFVSVVLSAMKIVVDSLVQRHVGIFVVERSWIENDWQIVRRSLERSRVGRAVSRFFWRTHVWKSV